MCDELTEAENSQWIEERGLGRRQFTLMGASAAGLALFPGCASGSSPDTTAGNLVSTVVQIKTADGMADAFFVHPTKGRHPAVIMWPDVAGLRNAYKTMGIRLAQAGHAVLVVNQYYRSAPAPIFSAFAEWRTDAGRARLMPMIDAITPAGTLNDANAFIDWLDKQAQVDTSRKVGSCGYCMGGPFTFRTAAARPQRVGAVASLHGGGLVTDQPDSPHRLIGSMRAALMIAIAQNDDARQPEAKDILRAAAQAARLPAEVKVYPAQHGWCTIDSPVYDKAQAEMSWDRMLATFRKHL